MTKLNDDSYNITCRDISSAAYCTRKNVMGFFFDRARSSPHAPVGYPDGVEWGSQNIAIHFVLIADHWEKNMFWMFCYLQRKMNTYCTKIATTICRLRLAVPILMISRIVQTDKTVKTDASRNRICP